MARRTRSLFFLVGLLACVSACGDGGRSGSESIAVLEPHPATRPSSLRGCGECDYGEACDAITFDLLCEPPGSCGGEQTGDLRCHHICEGDTPCSDGERCERRPVFVSDTPTLFLNLCVCAGRDCEPPKALPDEGGIAPFRSEAPLPVDLYYHASTAGAGHLFVSGGLRFRDSSSLDRVSAVYASKISAGGRLSPWRQVGQLPELLVLHAMIVVENRLYVIGGEPEYTEAKPEMFSRRVWSAPIHDGGQLGSFRAEAPMPHGRRWHTALAYGRRIIVAGGEAEGTSLTGLNELLVADVTEEGRVEGFSTIRVPEPLHYDGGSAVSQGRFYAVSAEGALFSIEVAALEAAQWRRESHVPRWGALDNRPRSTVRAAAFADALVFILNTGIAASAPLDDQGRVGEFRAAQRILSGLSGGFSLATAPNDRIYVAGGHRDSSRVREVLSTERR